MKSVKISYWSTKKTRYTTTDPFRRRTEVEVYKIKEKFGLTVTAEVGLRTE